MTASGLSPTPRRCAPLCAPGLAPVPSAAHDLPLCLLNPESPSEACGAELGCSPNCAPPAPLPPVSTPRDASLSQCVAGRHC